MTLNAYCGLAYLLVLFLMFPSVAYAYVDLGTGSIIVQAAIAGVLGALFWIKMYWRRIVKFTKRMISKK
jgi:membrane associated rhomboid family serine protease